MTEAEILKEIEETKKNGAYEMGTELLDSLKNLENVLTDEKVTDLNEYCLDLYSSYLDDLFLRVSDEVRESYLNRLRIDEVIKNQKMENEDPFVTSVYMNLQNEFGIDRALKTDKYDLDSILEIYKLLIRYTDSDTKDIHFRDNNTKFVGTNINGDRRIQYFPIDYKKVPLVMQAICDFINGDMFESEKLVFIKPIIVHGLITAFQPFNDGNSRLARVIMHDLIYKLSKKYGLTNFDLPVVYTSKASMAFRDNYRAYIKNLVIHHDKKAWTRWIEFNLSNIETSLEYDRENKLAKIIIAENKKLI